jgi:hypothetical protein
MTPWTQEVKSSKLSDLREEAKNLQAQLGFLAIQKENAEKEIQRIRVLLEYGEARFNEIQRQPVSEDASPEPEAPVAS